MINTTEYKGLTGLRARIQHIVDSMGMIESGHAKLVSFVLLEFEAQNIGDELKVWVKENWPADYHLPCRL